jgi:hypothetical protein
LEPARADETGSEAAATADPAPGDLEFPAGTYEIPESVQVLTNHERPTRDDIEEAISELTKVSPSALEAAKRRSIPVVFVRDWRIDKVKLKSDQGWIELRVQSSGERSPDGTWKKSHVQKLRCELRRNQTGWILFSPSNRLYVTDQSR